MYYKLLYIKYIIYNCNVRNEYKPERILYCILTLTLKNNHFQYWVISILQIFHLCKSRMCACKQETLIYTWRGSKQHTSSLSVNKEKQREIYLQLLFQYIEVHYHCQEYRKISFIVLLFCLSLDACNMMQ